MTKPIWPKVPAGFVRSMLTGHSALGLFLAALAYLVCVTGALVVIEHELARWEQPVAAESGVLSAAQLNRAVAAALARADGKIKSVSVALPGGKSARGTVTVSAKTSKTAIIGPAGTLLEEAATPWIDDMRELHANLHLGKWGYVVVGIVGVGMLGLAVGGVLSHPRVFRDAFTLRWGGSKRLQEADLHNRLSVWGLPFYVAISITGAWFGLIGLLIMLVSALQFDGDNSKISAAVRPPPAAADPRPAPIPDLGAVVAHVRSDPAVADKPFSVSLSRPGTMGQAVSVYSQVANRMLYGEMYQARAGQPIKRVGFSDGAFGVQLYWTVYPLHFGDFGGLPVKLLYIVLGFSLSVICSSGVSIWLARRRDQGRPAPRWERVWNGVAWGVLIGLAFSALGAAVFGAPALTLFWASLIVCVLGALAAPAQAGSMGLKGALTVLLIALPAMDLARHGALALQPLSLTVDITLILLSVWTGLLAYRTARPGAGAPRLRP